MVYGRKNGKRRFAGLERLAGLATPGPWFVHDFADPVLGGDPSARDVTVSCTTPDHITVASMGGGLYGHKGLKQARADAAYITAVNPKVLLEMIAEFNEMVATEDERQHQQRVSDR